MTLSHYERRQLADIDHDLSTDARLRTLVALVSQERPRLRTRLRWLACRINHHRSMRMPRPVRRPHRPHVHLRRPSQPMLLVLVLVMALAAAGVIVTSVVFGLHPLMWVAAPLLSLAVMCALTAYRGRAQHQ